MTNDTHDALTAFAATAANAVAECAGLAPRARATCLAEAGLIGVLAAESAGGLALGLDHAVPVLHAAGAGLLGYPLLESMLLAAALGGQAEAARIVLGEATATIAWAGRATLAGGRLSGTVGRAPMADSADLILVLTGTGAALVGANAAGVTVRPGAGLDVEAPDCEVVLANATPLALLEADAVDAIEQGAQLLRAAAIGGAVETCLAAAVAYTSTRVQFGKALVSFQALRHAMSRQKLAAEHIGAAIARSLMRPDDRLARAAAFAAATRFGAAAVESALQLHGGMGFTWDIPMHRHLRRIRSWEAQGDAPGLHRRLAAELLTANA